MANNVAIRGEVTPGGGWKDILNMTPTGAMEVGSGSARLVLYSSNDPSVEIDGVPYKLYTEHFPPPSVAAGLLKVTTFTASQTWTKQAGTKKIIVEVIGGGGVGGKTWTDGQNGARSCKDGYRLSGTWGSRATRYWREATRCARMVVYLHSEKNWTRTLKADHQKTLLTMFHIN